jgi:Zn-dependent M28 family amino/carboxypeptidase
MGTLKASARTLEQANVAAVVPGTDPRLKDEVVVYTAHWDHLGKGEGSGDTIYNGAVDNASGSAALLAMAQAAMQAPARRSQLFLWVCGEEQGLLGSEAYALRPLWPLDRTAADLNLDSLNWVGPTADINVSGSERSDLEGLARQAATGMGLRLATPAPDLGGGYFRSDHFSFAKVGVPAFSIKGGWTYLKDPKGSAEKAASYRPKYHQVTDEYDPGWDLEGAVQQAQFTLELGRLVADASALPAWKPGDPFGRARRK